MRSEKIRVRCTFIDSILGGEPNNAQLHEDYIQSKIPEDMYDPDELKRIKEEELTALDKFCLGEAMSCLGKA